MNWDTDIIRLGWSIATTCFALAAGVYTWFVARSKHVQNAIGDLDSRMDGIEHRVLSAEAELRYVPSNAEIRELHADISKLSGEMREINGTLKGVNRAVDLMNQHLLRTDSSSHE